MNEKITFLVLSIAFSNFINSATQLPANDIRIDIAEELQAGSRASSLDVDRGAPTSAEDSAAIALRAESRPASRVGSVSTEDSAAIAHRTRINALRVSEAHEILSDDYMDNLKDLKKTRWFFRKTANCTEVAANVLLYVGAGLSTLSSVMCLVGAEGAANTVLFVGTSFIVSHVAFMGIARCSAREEREREHLLKNLARKVNFEIVPLPNTIGNGDENETSERQVGGLTEVLTRL